MKKNNFLVVYSNGFTATFENATIKIVQEISLKYCEDNLTTATIYKSVVELRMKVINDEQFTNAQLN